MIIQIVQVLLYSIEVRSTYLYICKTQGLLYREKSTVMIAKTNRSCHHNANDHLMKETNSCYSRTRLDGAVFQTVVVSAQTSRTIRPLLPEMEKDI